MNDTMTMAEIEAQFPLEWILVDELQVDESSGAQRGRVVCHSPNRDEVYSKLLKLRPKRFAVLRTKKLPPGRVYALTSQEVLQS